MARDALGRGLRVLLAERGDSACATSSASSKLIHEVLRYLGRLELELELELKLVHEPLTERAELLGTAPHLGTPLKLLLPIFA